MKKFWISYVCFTVALPLLFVQIHFDMGLVVMSYILSLFTAVGVLVGSLKLKFVVKALLLALISGITAWITVVATSAPHDRTDFTAPFLLLATLMTIGCLARAAATESKRQSFLGFIAAVSTTAMIVTVIFVRALLPKEEVKVQRNESSRYSDLHFSQRLENTYPTATNVHSVTTNALPVPELKL
ncbi:MAG: hypothetical protein ABSH14_10140 [Verrucomicrobiia bacterium]|jgi:hypothetical protein